MVSANGEWNGAPFGGRGVCGVCVKVIWGRAGGSGVCSG
jgi:hypothetical protein